MSVVDVTNIDNNNESSAENRKKHLNALFEEREAQRQADVAARNEKRNQEKAAHESVDLFTVSFNAETEKIKDDLKLAKECIAPSNNPSSIVNDLEQISFRVDMLQKYFNESTGFLPVRSIGHYANQIKLLQDSVAEIKQSLAPAKKFAFKAKKKPGAANKQIQPAATVLEPKKEDVKQNFTIQPLYDGITDQLLTVVQERVNGQDVVLQNISNSQLRILGHPATLHLLNVESSEVLIGPCSTSVFLEKCSNSTIVLACQQLRCHSTNNCNLYVHITSRGIIEDCHNIRIAPYSLSYPDLDQDFEQSNLPKDRNNWDKIDDFNWLSKTEKSPNFNFIPDSERKSFAC